MAKADKTYVYGGAIYLEGAEMPEGWKRPPEKGPTPGVKMVGPDGVLPEFPPAPLPPGVKRAGVDAESGMNVEGDTLTTGKKPKARE